MTPAARAGILALLLPLCGCLVIEHRVEFASHPLQRIETVRLRTTPDVSAFLNWQNGGTSSNWCRSFLATTREDGSILPGVLRGSSASLDPAGTTCTIRLAPQSATLAPASAPGQPLDYVISPGNPGQPDTHTIDFRHTTLQRIAASNAVEYIIWSQCRRQACTEATRHARDRTATMNRCIASPRILDEPGFEDCVREQSFIAYESRLQAHIPARRSLVGRAAAAYRSARYLLHITSPRRSLTGEPPLQPAWLPPETGAGATADQRRWRHSPAFEDLLRRWPDAAQRPNAPWHRSSHFWSGTLAQLSRHPRLTWRP